jgi:DNA-binding transcriptional regulator PaaX
MTKIPVQNQQRVALQTVMLRTLYVAGALSVALLAPRLTKLVPSFDRSKKRREELYTRIRAARTSLKSEGCIEEQSGRIRLTKKGTQRIERLLMREYRIPEQIHWDGKWRILMFDIREQRRKTRSKLRHLLQAAGFLRLQDSVWIYPYPCDEFVALVRAHLASGVGELRSLVAEALEADRTIRDHFKLS